MIDLSNPLCSYSLDRITLKTGDIFLGTIVDEKFSRYHIERCGYITILPTWEVKRIEKNQSNLSMNTESIPFKPDIKTQTIQTPSVVRIQNVTPENVSDIESLNGGILPWKDTPMPQNVRMFELMGKSIPVVSAPPAEPSHLEMYSQRSHFWSPSNRYLRGYLVNQTEKAYHSLRVEIIYYTELPESIDSATRPHTDFRQETEIFQVYPMTMKPFIVDTRFVEWEKVKRILFQIVGRKPMASP